MNGTKKPDPLDPADRSRVAPPPLPPRPRSKSPSPAALVIVLCVVLIGLMTFWYLRRPARVGGSAAVAIPAEMGGSVRTAALGRLFDETAKRDLDSLGLRLSVGQGGDKPVYRIGDTLRVGFSSQRPALCAVFHRDARGAISLIHPDAGETPLIRAGQEWVSDELGVTEPTGSESFLVACGLNDDERQRIDLANILAGNVDEWGKQLSAVRRDFEVRER